jgi:hypothetical protein
MNTLILQFKTIIIATAVFATVTMAVPAYADSFCLQLNGGPFSADLGFFRFKGNRPLMPGAIVDLKGRVAGLSPVFGTATVAKDGSFLEIAATFFADGEEGQIDVQFFPPNNTSGSGYGNYGAYGTSQSFTATVVSCALEP